MQVTHLSHHSHTQSPLHVRQMRINSDSVSCYKRVSISVLITFSTDIFLTSAALEHLTKHKGLRNIYIFTSHARGLQAFYTIFTPSIEE